MRNHKRVGVFLAATLSFAALGTTAAVAAQPGDVDAKGTACRTADWGIGCYVGNGDKVVVRDWKADGKWVKSVVEVSDGSYRYCEDHGADGPEIRCDYNLSEKLKVRVRAELWNGRDFITATDWSRWVAA
jgi:hypothetical protein